jgi:multicomponent Na+:H+ antiporter subunit A
MLLAHGLFKAPLFLAVGAIDHATGTRDLRELSGLGQAMPGLAIASALAASMAGAVPLLGFLGKEAAFTAFLHDGRAWAAVGLVAGSVLTTAYSARFLWGAFARKSGVATTSGEPLGPALAWPVWMTALSGLALGVVHSLVDAPAQAYAAA